MTTTQTTCLDCRTCDQCHWCGADRPRGTDARGWTYLQTRREVTLCPACSHAATYPDQRAAISIREHATRTP
jgi:hypothetical protein